jgi:hypothetical protein
MQNWDLPLETWMAHLTKQTGAIFTTVHTHTCTYIYIYIYTMYISHGFDSWWGDWILSIYLILPAALAPGIYSAANTYEYQKQGKCFCGVKRGRRVSLTTSSPSASRLSRQCEIFSISQPCRPPRPATGIVLLVIYACVLSAYLCKQVHSRPTHKQQNQYNIYMYISICMFRTQWWCTPVQNPVYETAVFTNWQFYFLIIRHCSLVINWHMARFISIYEWYLFY